MKKITQNVFGQMKFRGWMDVDCDVKSSHEKCTMNMLFMSVVNFVYSTL